MRVNTQWPRVRGQTGQVAEPEEWLGKWVWKIEIFWEKFRVKEKELMHVINSHELKNPRFFDSLESAQKDLENECDTICSLINKAAGGTGKEGFLDMQDGMKHKFSMETK